VLRTSAHPTKDALLQEPNLCLYLFDYPALIIPEPTFVSLPALFRDNLETAFCITSTGEITRQKLLADAVSISEKLPEKSYAVNLCQNRYFFIVAYLAVAIRNQVSLLPPNQSPRTIKNLLSVYPNSYCITDELDYKAEAHGIGLSSGALQINEQDYFLMPEEITESDSGILPIIDINRTISISFTSGSTGKPKAIEKNWREFQASAELALKQFNLSGQTATLVSTVPAQHMYGLETSLFWPLFSGLSIHDSRPFYPEDIGKNLKSLDSPGILVSTPTHLKACTKIKSLWPDLDMLLSSTAPLSPALAQQIETTFNAPLYELFGSTETLSFASRRAVKSPEWQTYQGIRLWKQKNGFVVGGGHLLQPVRLDDSLLLYDEQTFSVQGRSDDLIKIAGKRASLAELNLILNHINGIDDGIFIRFRNERLSAIVVSDLPKKTILAELKQSIDAVFLPRMIFYVPVVPRNMTGKIDKTELQDLIQGLQIV
jgi:acyl-CoA synthetase (AMP-forming)/AMP-acid ligase II